MNRVSAASFMIGAMIMGRSLSEMFPELAEEWSDRNLPLRPDQITYGSNKRVWWHGKCGHEWETSVKARTSGERCPYCFYNGKKSTYRKTIPEKVHRLVKRLRELYLKGLEENDFDDFFGWL